VKANLLKGEIMTNKQIEQAEKDLCEIEKIQIPDGGTLKQVKISLVEFADEHEIHKMIFDESHITEWTRHMFAHCHTFLQTKMMLNACVSARESGELAKQSCGLAKWCCFWAAIAAIAACISVVLTLLK